MVRAVEHGLVRCSVGAGQPAQAAAREIGVDARRELIEEANQFLGIRRVLDVLPVDQLQLLRHREAARRRACFRE